VPYVVGLTGTPVLNKPFELWPLLKIIRPELFPSRWGFGKRYCDPKMTPYGWKFDGADNLGELHNILVARVMIRRLRADVLPQLPAHRTQVVPLPISDPGQYAKAEDDFRAWLADRGRQSKSVRAEAVVKLGYLVRLAGELKLPAVKGWVSDYLQGCADKLIVFGRHKHVLGPLREEFPHSAFVDGSVSGKDRQAAFDEFTKSRRCRVLFGNLQAAGVGWNGTAAPTVAFAEYGWTPAEHDQATARVRRIGQTKETCGVYLTAAGTVEDKLVGILQRKAEVINQAVDGGSGGGEAVFDELLDSIAGVPSL
jgi:SWI/SNF-related matrix-associated actin-dependent regulator 1 of chromatin subfamily A